MAQEHLPPSSCAAPVAPLVLLSDIPLTLRSPIRSDPISRLALHLPCAPVFPFLLLLEQLGNLLLDLFRALKSVKHNALLDSSLCVKEEEGEGRKGDRGR
jgi:hypothetical protein